MLLVPVAFLRPGMTVARPVLHPDKDALLLLAEGQTLDGAAINHLRAHKVTHAWVCFAGLEDLDRAFCPGVSSRHVGLVKALNTSIDTLERRVAVKTNVQHYRRAVHQMLAEIIANPDHAPLTHQLASCGPTLAGHMANVAYLALLVGAHLSGYLRLQRRSLPADLADNTAQLGLGALLHDIGKINMPDHLKRVGILDPEASAREYRTHVLSGYAEVRDHIPSVASYIVLHHHQRFDGRGFPRRQHEDGSEGEGFVGQKIHVFARIVGAADAFDHLMCPGGRPTPTVIAIHAMRSGMFNGWFDPVVVDALIRLVPAFMIGSIVTLSDGSEAAVTTSHEDAPCRPTVRLLTAPISDPSSRASRRQLDLRMCPDLHIASVDGVDVTPFLFDAAPELVRSSAA